MACTHVFLSELLLIRLTKTHVRRRIYPTPTVRNSLTEDPPFLESLEFLRFAVFTSFATFADGRKVHKAFLVEKYQFQKDSGKTQSPLFWQHQFFHLQKLPIK